MPEIFGYGYIPVDSVNITGDIVHDNTPGQEANVLSMPLEASIIKSGNIQYNYDPGTALELFDGAFPSGTPMGLKTISALPVDFRILSIQSRDGFLVFGFPTPAEIFYEQSACVFNYLANVQNLASSISGWNGSIDTWDPDAFQDEMLSGPFNISADVSIDGTLCPPGPSITLKMGDVTSATDYEENEIPTNVLIFTFSGTFESGGNVPGPVEDIHFDPYPDAITFTPPEDATTVTIVIPGEPDEVIPVTPGVPVTVPLPPGAPVVEITPEGPGGPGPPIIVPVALEYETQIVVDVAFDTTLLLLVDPSGIYTLVPGVFRDVLYEHGLSPVGSNTVAIPRPYGVTSLIPEGDD